VPYKQSGIGRETHKTMLDHYQQAKNLLVSYGPKKLGFFRGRQDIGGTMPLIAPPTRLDEMKYPALPKIDRKIFVCAAVRYSKIPQDECNPSTTV
jgi:hypothetical protein